MGMVNKMPKSPPLTVLKITASFAVSIVYDCSFNLCCISLLYLMFIFGYQDFTVTNVNILLVSYLTQHYVLLILCICM